MNYADALTVREYVDYCKENDTYVHAAVLEQAGYFQSSIDPKVFWEEAHRYMTDRYGKDNYIWTGEKFWFDTEEEAIQFYAFFRDWLED
jgi:hypothetical protein